MEQISFLVVLIVALAVGLAIQFLSFVAGARAMRFSDRSLSRALKTIALVMVASWGLKATAVALSGMDSLGLLPAAANVALFLVAISIVRKAYNTTARRAIGALAFTFVAGVLYAIPLRAFVLQSYRIPSGNMIPTFQIGDYVLASKYAYGSFEPGRGDIVVFAFPPDPGKSYIKRVIGVPGEEIEIRNKKVFINGSPMDDPWGRFVESTTIPPGAGKGTRRDNLPPTKIPADAYFVLGDNRDGSYDSRFWGLVPRKNLIGKVMLRYWPASAIGAAR